MPDLVIAPGVRIPEEAIAFRAIRSAGPGGQNVNKVASKVELRVPVDAIVGLSPGARERLRTLAGRRWIEGDVLLVTASETRNQLDNRELAETKLSELVRESLVAPKLRRATKATRGSHERRIEAKKGRSERKQNRGKLRDFD